ncbi:MAG TPA: HAMP domain-containing sensor histidine kinase [Polyangiaceae bacterium]
MTSRAKRSLREVSGSRPRSSRPDASRLALLDHLRQAEVRAASSQVASVIGHMIGTPLNVIVGRAALLRASNPESMLEHAQRIEDQAQRLAERFQRLIHYLTVPEPDYEPNAAQLVLDDALELFVPIGEEEGVTLVKAEGDVPPDEVEGIPALMVLGSLLSFAIRTTRAGLSVELGASAAEGGVTFSIEVPEMPQLEGRLDRLDPPEKYDPSSVEREQLLATCAAIAKRYGGRLQLDRAPDGAAAILRLFCPSVPARS